MDSKFQQTEKRIHQILLIDSAFYAAALKTTLFKAGDAFEISAMADSFKQIKEILVTKNPDLILINPGVLKSELEACMQFLKSEYTQIPVIGFLEATQEFNPYKSGIEVVFEKPANLFELNSWQGNGSALLDFLHRQFGIQRFVRVMLVDDAALMVKLLRQILGMDPMMQVIVDVGNGQDALEILSSQQPDVILLDIEMPIMDGLTFLKHARIKTRAKVIILSSVSMAGSSKAAIARSLGADAVLAKPSGAISLDLKEKVGRLITDTIYQVLRE